MVYTIQYLRKIPNGTRSTSEYECESLEEAEERAVSVTSGQGLPPLDGYDVAIIRRNDRVLLRYFHTIELP